MRSLSCAALLLAAPFAFPTSAQDSSAPGFALAPAPYPGAPAFGATTTLSNGDFLVFDGLEVLQYASDGALVRPLGALTSPVFPSFILTDPDENDVYFGESSTGTIYRLFVGLSSGPDPVATLPNNYDAAMFDDAALFVSAATCGFGCGNQIWRVDLASFQLHQVAQVPGASGPLAFDGQGNLYYGTASAAFPPPPHASKLFRWSPAQLAQPNVLGLADAQFLAGGYEGAARLAFDQREGALYLVETSFASGANRIRRILGGPAQSPVLVEGQTFRSIGNLSFHSGTAAARFLPFQPPGQPVLSYTTTDFVAPPVRFVLRPARPSLSFSGPGTSGPGPFELRLENGPPSGFARVLWFPATRLHAPESVRTVAGVPLFLGVVPGLGSAGLAGAELRALDASGGLQLGGTNPAGLTGVLAAQLVLYDGARRLVGSSSAKVL